MATPMTNDTIADMLDRIGQLLETREKNPYRVRAYHNAAATVRETAEPIADLARTDDRAALMKLPGIGESLAALIVEFVTTGSSDFLRELESETTPENTFSQVPGIGPALSKRLVETLGIRTLEELEQAAHDGRLDEVEGFGKDRVKAVRATLAGMLSESAGRRARQRTEGTTESREPSVATLLDVDKEYRSKAAAGELPTIAPKRFNPGGEAWLPVLHTRRDGWAFTALFSNTARAHEADKTDDWVVLYFETEGQAEEQRTVVTETKGPLAGKRVVRGRAAETRRTYDELG